MNGQFVLLKFFEKKEYAEAFLSGRLYMNSLGYFWNEYNLRDHNDNLNSNQADLFEGTVGSQPDEKIKADFGDNGLSDAIYRAIGYQYCNVLCFFKLKYQLDGIFLRYDEPDMSDFGNYVVIIKNEPELVRRIGTFIAKRGDKYLCGDVHYHLLMKGSERSSVYEKNHIVLRVESSFDMNALELKARRDCFSKMDKYAFQKEWRLAVYRGVKSTEAYEPVIEKLEDIAVCVTRDKLCNTIDELFRKGEMKPSLDGYDGNIGKDEMKRLFYELGDNKAEMLTFIG